MVEIIQNPLEIQDPERPEKCAIRNGAIQLSNIDFAYEGGHKILQNFSLQVQAGEKVGIVGFSGAGKSTLFKLLLRFIDVQKGSIAIDVQDIRNITQEDLRKHIGYVPQDPILFHRSLQENIAYAKPNVTKKQIIEAATKAHAHEFISTLPHGYKTFVGERGVKLSGGERQRVAIARAILKDAPILLLDEATSSLDSVSEKYIQEQSADLMSSRTTIAIAHRISTIQQMDRIIVLDKGKIIEEGTHMQLLRKKGQYANLWSHQSEGFLLDTEE